MNRTSQHNEFTLNVTNQTLVISSTGGSLGLAPAEVIKINDAISLLLRMASLPVKPPEISFSPFRIEIEDDFVVFTKGEDRLSVDWNNLDSLSGAAQSISQIARDMLVLGKDRPRPRQGLSGGLTR